MVEVYGTKNGWGKIFKGIDQTYILTIETKHTLAGLSYLTVRLCVVLETRSQPAAALSHQLGDWSKLAAILRGQW